jgi:hypothetical protein
MFVTEVFRYITLSAISFAATRPEHGGLPSDAAAHSLRIRSLSGPAETFTYLILQTFQRQNFFRTTYKTSVPISLETYCVSATKPKQLKLFKKISPIYCKKESKQTEARCGQKAKI